MFFGDVLPYVNTEVSVQVHVGWLWYPPAYRGDGGGVYNSSRHQLDW